MISLKHDLTIELFIYEKMTDIYCIGLMFVAERAVHIRAHRMYSSTECLVFVFIKFVVFVFYLFFILCPAQKLYRSRTVVWNVPTTDMK